VFIISGLHIEHIFIQAVRFTGLNGTKSTDRFIRPT